METEFRSEAALEDNQALSGMTREMFLMQDLEWELEPPSSGVLNIPDVGLQRHVEKYISDPIHLKLLKRPGKHGLRAVGTTDSGRKFRAFWRQGQVGNRLKASELLQAPYEEAVKSRLFLVEFEVVLPSYKKKRQQPSIVYQVAVEGGGMNPKAMVPRGGSTIKVYPSRSTSSSEDNRPILAGKAPVGLRMKPGIVDPSWSRGRNILRVGKSTGFV